MHPNTLRRKTLRSVWQSAAAAVAVIASVTAADQASAQIVIDTFSGPDVNIAACGNDVFAYQENATFLGGAREAQARDGHSCVFGGKSRVTISSAAQKAAFYGRSACEQSLMYGTEIGTIDHSWSRSPNKGKGTPLNLSLTLTSKFFINVVQLPPGGGFFGLRVRAGNGGVYSASLSFTTTGMKEVPLSAFTGITAAAAADIDGISLLSGACPSNNIADALMINGLAVGSSDADGDGVPDSQDAFPNDPTESADTDGDGHGDNSDAFPSNPNEWADTDGDGHGDNSDAFPSDPTEWVDTDGDGHGDNGDAFPSDPTEWADTDGDGHGNNSDVFPTDPTEWADTDHDGIGDNADVNDNSNLSATVVINGINSGVANKLFQDGNTLADLVGAGSAGCTAASANHGQYSSCMAKVFNALLSAGKINSAEKDALQSAVAQSAVGKKK